MSLTSAALNLELFALVGLYLSFQLSACVLLSDSLSCTHCHVDEKQKTLIMGAVMTCHVSPVIQMKCMSCYQSCQRALPTCVQNVLTTIQPSGGQRWRGSSKAVFVTYSLHCSTHAHPHTCCATDRLGSYTVALFQLK